MEVDPPIQQSHIVSLNGSSEALLDLEKLSDDNFHVSSELEKQDHQKKVSVLGSSFSDVFTNALVKMCATLRSTDVVNDIDLLDAPGSETKSETLAPLHIGRIHSSRSHERFPKITLYAALAMFRQKLHDEVLRECSSSLIGRAFNKFWFSYRSSKKNSKLKTAVGFQISLFFLYFPPRSLSVVKIILCLRLLIHINKADSAS